MRALLLLLGLIAVPLMSCSSCGNKDGEIDPGKVNFAHLKDGFWNGELGPNYNVTAQFLTAGEVRKIYGGTGMRAIGTAALGSGTIDHAMDYFEDDDEVMLLFHNGTRVESIYAVQVQDGMLGVSRLGEIAGNVTDGVLFTFGFAPPVDIPIAAFTTQSQLTLDDHEQQLPTAFSWTADCRWQRANGWHSIGSLDYDSSLIPWAMTYFSKSGVLTSHREGMTSTIMKAGACAIDSGEGVASQVGHTVVPWGDGGALLYHDRSGELRGIELSEIFGQPMTEQLASGRIGPWRALDDRTFAVMHRVGDGSANPPPLARAIRPCQRATWRAHPHQHWPSLHL